LYVDMTTRKSWFHWCNRV